MLAGNLQDVSQNAVLCHREAKEESRLLDTRFLQLPERPAGAFGKPDPIPNRESFCESPTADKVATTAHKMRTTAILAASYQVTPYVIGTDRRTSLFSPLNATVVTRLIEGRLTTNSTDSLSIDGITGRKVTQHSSIPSG